MQTLQRSFATLCLVLVFVGCSSDPGTVDPPDASVEEDATADDVDAMTASDMNLTDAEDASPDLSDDAGDAGGEAALTIEEFCDEMIQAAMENWWACFGSPQYDPELQDNPFRDGLEARCKEEATASIDAGTLRLDDRQAAVCAEAMRERAGTCWFRGPPSTYLPECETVVEPSSAVGEACLHGVTIFEQFAECEGGTCSKDQGDYCPGTCVALTPIGESCENSRCVAEGFCYSGTCVGYRQQGEACDRPSGQRCVSGFVCDSASTTCVPLVEVGEPCTDGTVCRVHGLGDQGATVSLCIDGLCASKAELGEPCLARFHCAGATHCVGADPANGQPGSCQPLGTAGEACPCADGFFCESDACVAFPVIGESCEVSRRCAEGWCRSTASGDTCEALGEVGSDCSQDLPNFEGVGCVAGAFCMSDETCRLPGGAGDPCREREPETCSLEFFCDAATETCRPLAENGEACNPYSLAPEEVSRACVGESVCVCTGRAGDTSCIAWECRDRKPLGGSCTEGYECETELVCRNDGGSGVCFDPSNPMCG